MLVGRPHSGASRASGGALAGSRSKLRRTLGRPAHMRLPVTSSQSSPLQLLQFSRRSMRVALKLLATTAFAEFDADASGRISTWELQSALGRMGIKMTDGEIAQLMQRYDTDGNQELDQSEFMGLVSAFNDGSLDLGKRNGHTIPSLTSVATAAASTSTAPTTPPPVPSVNESADVISAGQEASADAVTALRLERDALSAELAQLRIAHESQVQSLRDENSDLASRVMQLQAQLDARLLTEGRGFSDEMVKALGRATGTGALPRPKSNRTTDATSGTRLVADALIRRVLQRVLTQHATRAQEEHELVEDEEALEGSFF